MAMKATTSPASAALLCLRPASPSLSETVAGALEVLDGGSREVGEIYSDFVDVCVPFSWKMPPARWVGLLSLLVDVGV